MVIAYEVVSVAILKGIISLIFDILEKLCRRGSENFQLVYWTLFRQSR